MRRSAIAIMAEYNSPVALGTVTPFNLRNTRATAIPVRLLLSR